jgi:hydroxylysine kinase
VNALFAKVAAPTPVDEVELLARDHFGIIGTAQRLSSERDQNFHFAAQDGHEYILKIANPAEPPSVSELQTRALEHVARVNPALPVPRVVRSLHGETEVRLTLSDATTRTVRVVTCLSGEPLYKVLGMRSLRQAIGRCLADLAVALADFEHPAANHPLLWDLSAANQVKELLVHVVDADGRALAARFLERFEQNALPLLRSLPRQLIHNDFNPHNVLIDPADTDRITGIIDFGDAVLAPRVNDVAIAASYHLGSGGNPIAAAGELIGAYHSGNPLSVPELVLLPDLIGARLAMTVVITHWRATLDPHNRGYILRNAPIAWAGMLALEAVTAEASERLLRELCPIG